MTNQPKLADVRQFLFDFFNDEEVTTLCFDYFPQVHDDFAAGMTKQQKIIMLLEYCRHRELVPNLLGALQRARPEPYAKRFPQAPQAEARPESAKPVRDPKSVFISHAHEDAEFAHRLANDLQQSGWHVWIAPDSIRPGEMWGEGIDRGLAESGVLVLLLTPRSVQSSWVRKETYVAIQLESQGHIKFIPLEVEPCDVPGLWSTYQRIPFQSDYGRGLTELLDTLEPERRVQREREAQEKAAKEKTEQLEREMEQHRLAAQAEAERQARLAAEKAKAERLEQERKEREAQERAKQIEVERQAKLAAKKAESKPVTQRSSTVPDVQALEDLKNDSFRTRVAAVNALAQLGAQFIQPIIGMLADDYPQVHVAAIQALEKLQPTGEWRKHLKYECYVPAGKFIMGDDKSGIYEKPAHEVDVAAFYIGKYPVTNAEYQRYMDDLKRAFQIPPGKEKHPMVNVSWYDARDYAAWAAMRLLTEAEWEKAASWEDAGSADQKAKGKKRKYPWGDRFGKNKCNTSESGIGTTSPVGAYSPQGDSPYGCADMAGNVWEWTSSLKRGYPYKASDGREDLSSSGYRVLRGGSYDNDEYHARCASRYSSAAPDYEWSYLGFRCGA